jgi:hypothetical protein
MRRRPKAENTSPNEKAPQFEGLRQRNKYKT